MHILSQAVAVVHAFNSRTQMAETDRTLWVWGQPALQELVPEQSGLHRETLYQETKTKKKRYAHINSGTKGSVLVTFPLLG